jgi:glucokinase
VLALDVGGTKLAAAVIDRAGNRISRGEVATPRILDGELLLARLVDLAREIVAAAGLQISELAGVGIGSAGPLDSVAGTISPVNIAAWRLYPLADQVAAELLADVEGFRRPVLAGDGLCFTLGEQRFGAGRGSTALLGMVVSTGIGGGLVLDGKLYAGPSGNAGHIGHIVVQPDGVPCPCGNRGCLERIASGPSMVAYALDQGWTPDAATVPDGVALAAAARAGNAAALSSFERAGEAIGRAIVLTATLVDIREVVIGGGMSATGELLFAPIRDAVQRHAVLAFTQGIEIRASELDRDAGLLGAAALAMDAADAAYRDAEQVNRP